MRFITNFNVAIRGKEHWSKGIRTILFLYSVHECGMMKAGLCSIMERGRHNGKEENLVLFPPCRVARYMKIEK